MGVYSESLAGRRGWEAAVPEKCGNEVAQMPNIDQHFVPLPVR